MTTEETNAIGHDRGGRMSRQRKRDAVLRLLRGGNLETISRSVGVTATTLATWHATWRGAFLFAGEVALATRPESGETLKDERLKAKLGKVVIGRDLLHERIAVLESGRHLAGRGRGDERRRLAGHRPSL